MKAKNILIGLVALVVVGCGVEFRSPVVLKRTPKEEEKKPRPEEIVPPPPLTTKKQAEAVPEPTGPEGEPGIPTEVISLEEPTVPPEVSEETSPAGPVSARLPRGKPFVVSAKSIVILSKEYLKSTPYNVLEKITVQDVSQNGFTKQEAREALQFEAYRRFGSRANGIINVEYSEKTDSIPGSHPYSGVSGEVITWQEAALPPKTEPTPPKPEIEPEVKPEPEPEPEVKPELKPESEPLAPAPEIQPEIIPETKPETKPETEPATAPVPSVPETKAETPALGPSTAAKPEAEPVAPVAPPISEQPLEN